MGWERWERTMEWKAYKPLFTSLKKFLYS